MLETCHVPECVFSCNVMSCCLFCFVLKGGRGEIVSLTGIFLFFIYAVVFRIKLRDVCLFRYISFLSLSAFFKVKGTVWNTFWDLRCARVCVFMGLMSCVFKKDVRAICMLVHFSYWKLIFIK